MITTNPYRQLPEHTRWSKAVAELAYGSVDPVVEFPFKVNPGDKVATGGSCFAQHIARHLKANGFNYYVIEDGHPLGSDETKAAFNYGVFSARYGNLYTSRQLLQLFRRAFGTFRPVEEPWSGGHGQFIDPFRPNIQPNGYFSKEELIAERAQHLSRVRYMFETLDIFVFTLGLTECWLSRADGAVFPVCPGVAGGTFDEQLYDFKNLGVFDILAEMREFISLLKGVNHRAKIILTVSPVPLVATAVNRHVLVSTTYSKSVLRTVCEELTKQYGHVGYFPSYEIITGAFNRGRYFADDLRSVTEEGVEHVMRLFLKHAAATGDASGVPEAMKKDVSSDFLASMQRIVATTCEEELIETSY